MSKIYNILISKILEEIIPASKISISKGNKIFGAAILKKEDLSTVVLKRSCEDIPFRLLVTTFAELITVGVRRWE